MPDSDITITSLSTTPGVGHIALQYVVDDPHETGLLNLALDVVELYASTTNDRSTATKVAEGNKTNVAHLGLTEGVAWYYWARPRNRSIGPAGQRYYGDWYPLSPTAGVVGTVGFAAGTSLLNGRIDVQTSVGSPTTMVVSLKTLSGSDPSDLDPIFVSIMNENGTFTTLKVNQATSVTINNGSLLGAANAPARVWIIGFNDSGTLRLAVGIRACLLSTAQMQVFHLSEHGSINISQDTGGSGVAGTFYSSAAYSSVRFRVLGFMEFWGAINGNWTSAPSKTQLYTHGTPLPGQTIQTIDRSLLAAAQLNASAIPFDNSTPLVSEGDQLTTQAITATSRLNFIDHDLQMMVACSVASQHVIVGIFDNSDACIAAVAFYISTTNVIIPVVLKDREVSGSQDTTLTYKIRWGVTGGFSPPGDLYVNSTNALNSLFGGFANNTKWSLREVMT